MRTSGLPWRRWISGIVLAAVVLLAFALLFPAIQQMQQAAWRTQSRDNLHNIGIALHNYHDAHKAFPPGGIVNENGRGYHGWYTQTLPYVDASRTYTYIDFNYDWRDPENAHVFRSSIPVVLIPGIEETATEEGFGLNHYSGNPHVFHRNSHVAIGDMTAGTAHTWMVGGAAGNWHPWGSPFNWRPLGTKLCGGPDGYCEPVGDVAHLLFADGKVKDFAADTDASVLKRLASAPPAVTAEQTVVPPVHYRYSSAWESDSVPLKGLSSDLWGAGVQMDPSGSPYEVHIWYLEKVGRPEDAPDQRKILRQVAQRYPEMRELIGAPIIDDEMVKLIAGLPSLEVLIADGIDLSEAGLKNLQRLPKLKLLVIDEISRPDRSELEAALPNCTIRLGGPWSWE